MCHPINFSVKKAHISIILQQKYIVGNVFMNGCLTMSFMKLMYYIYYGKKSYYVKNYYTTL